MNWNLTPLFSDNDSAKEFLTQARELADVFQSDYKERLYTLNADDFKEALKKYEEIYENVGRVMTYIFLQFATDASKGSLLAEYETYATQIEENLLFFEIEFTQLPVEKRSRFIEHAGIYAYMLKNIEKNAKHKLTVPEEKISLKKNLTAHSAWSRLFDEHFSKLKFFFEGESISEEEILSKLYSSDRTIRKKAQISLTNELKKHQHLLSYIFNQIKKDHHTECELRKYDSPETPRHLSNNTSQKSVDNLINAVHKNVSIVHEYYEEKQKLLGVERLFDYDRYAPIKEKSFEVPFEKAKELVLRSFQNFSPTFYKIAQKAFDEGWIDVYPKEGKRGGAFSHGATPKVHPYVLLNYTNQRRDVFTLAHELGHAIHQYLSREVGYLNQDTPLTTAETASVFAEMLLFEELKKELDDETIMPLYAAKLEDIFATLFRQITFTDFERRVHAEDKELSAEEYNTLWQEENRRMFGDSITLTNNYSIWWSYIPHFIHSPFYCYAYGYAQLLVLALFGLYKEGYEKFEEKYLAFLRSGGSQSPKDQIAAFGYDIDEEAFWQVGLDQINLLLNEFKGKL